MSQLLEKFTPSSSALPAKAKSSSTSKSAGEFCAVLEPHNITVAADRLFIDHIEELVGRGSVRVLD